MQDAKKYEALNLPRVIEEGGTFALVGAAYIVLALAGLQIASLSPSVTPVWAPTGLAIAAVLLCGYRVAPAIFAAAFVVNQLTLPSIPTSTIIALGNTLEAVLASFLIGYWAEGLRAFATSINVIKFSVACTIATALGATIGVISLTLTGYAATDLFVPLWLTWWMGDLAGAIVVAPCLILWTKSQPRTPNNEVYKTIIAYVVAASIGLICLGPLLAQTTIGDALAYLAIGPLLWAALKLGPRDTAAVALILSGFAVWGAIVSADHSHLVSDQHLNNHFIALLVFIIGVTIPSLVLAAEVETRSDAETIRVRQDLEARVLWKASNRVASGGTLEDLLSDCLEQICNVANWQIGHVYLPDRPDDPRLLHPSSIWHFQSKTFQSIAHATEHIAMRRGQGLPGRVWASRKPQFIPDISSISDFPRRKIMLDHGLHAAFGFPIYADGTLQAVVEFFLSARQPPDDRLLRTVENIGDQLGRVLERQCAHEQEIALRQALDSLSTAVFFTDSAGRALNMNHAGKELLASNSALRINHDNVLAPTDRVAAAKFARALDWSAKGHAGAVNGPSTIAVSDGEFAGLIATVLPLKQSKLADLCGTPSASSVVFVQDPAKDTPGRSKGHCRSLWTDAQ